MEKLTASDNTIRDGMTQEGYIEAREGIHGPLEFEYRPMLPEHVAKVDAFIRDNEDVAPAEMVRGMANEVAKRLVSWSNECEPSFDNVRKQRRLLLLNLYKVIAGYVPSDAKPNAKGEEKGEDGPLGDPHDITGDLGNS